ncbi:Hypothetical predicted protein [Pelobates cultripes]|uniref:Uncharacterized protein n=1 Tax=Pelobates cultripes TaxID=61616 RepID=A0AAD1RUR7_PELCU|nr:Hypothetical predicted protein [Pelobates cultripes]
MRATQLPPNPMANPPENKPVAPSGQPVVGPQLRAPHRAKSVRKWKRAKALIESSNSESGQEEAQSESEEEDSDDSNNQLLENDSVTFTGMDHKDGADDSALVDHRGEPLFDPDTLQHPRSSKWYPLDHVAKYIAARIRKPLDKVARNKLRAECPRPTIPDMACATPEVDPKITNF